MSFLNFIKKKFEDTGVSNNVIYSVKILGSGCKYCHNLYENTKKAVDNLGLNVTVEYVTDLEVVAQYGVMTMPALVINENVVSTGKVCNTAEVERLFKNYNNKENKIKIKCDGKPKVAFICVHNSCRSQMAEAVGKLYASDVFESYSAGTELKDHINSDAVRLIKEIYGVDMEVNQYNKLISDIPTPDIVIFMGCNVKCPNLRGQYSENWGLDDPSGKSDVEFKEIINKIESNIFALKNKLK